mmetsp:Transcript_20606/g.45732  ORF Transcript_20606/g.45732 Transcript_20606/m.45732 type:complete len:114 (-) Transcript_20606:21-362(-)
MCSTAVSDIMDYASYRLFKALPEQPPDDQMQMVKIGILFVASVLTTPCTSVSIVQCCGSQVRGLPPPASRQQIRDVLSLKSFFMQLGMAGFYAAAMVFITLQNPDEDEETEGL